MFINFKKISFFLILNSFLFCMGGCSTAETSDSSNMLSVNSIAPTETSVFETETVEETPSASEKVTAEGYVTANSCNVRSSPSKDTEDNIIDTLLQGMSFTIDSFDGYWYHITYNGQEGYVSHKMIALKDNLCFSADVQPETSESVSETTKSLSGQANPVQGVLSGIKIGIDPGHQKEGNYEQEAVAPGSSETKYKVSGGAEGVATEIPEYVTNLEISQKLRDKLLEQGAVVYMTRETHDVDISNQERAKMMNDYSVDLMLRIHCDSSENSSSNGIALYVSESNSIADQSRKYAEIMLPVICEATGAKNNGIYQNDNYTGQNWAEVPCMMIECGFLSNPSEDMLLNSPEYQEKLTTGILESIIACFESNENSVIEQQNTLAE